METSVMYEAHRPLSTSISTSTQATSTSRRTST